MIEMEDEAMKLAYTMSEKRGGTNIALATMVDLVVRKGCKVAGTIQIDTERQASYRCDMDVKVLPDGPMIRISQSLGDGSQGCRLDPSALERAVGLVSADLACGVDLLVINKFGKHEAEGRGFRDLIGTALERNIPTIVGLNEANKAAFLAFAGDLAVPVPADALAAWALAQVATVDVLR
ncbi:MAG: DUF2478 domain-containing protein [Parvibaculum sp.]